MFTECLKLQVKQKYKVIFNPLAEMNQLITFIKFWADSAYNQIQITVHKGIRRKENGNVLT